MSQRRRVKAQLRFHATKTSKNRNWKSRPFSQRFSGWKDDGKAAAAGAKTEERADELGELRRKAEEQGRT